MVGTPYGGLDQFRDVAQADAARTQDLAEILERRGLEDDEVQTRRSYLDRLSIALGERVLDVGCGTGVVLRDVARRVGPHGQVMGVDPSLGLLKVAGELAARDGLADRVAFREGDARSLPLDDALFDVALAVTTLFHIPEGERAIPEMARVVRPGGRVAIVDRDNDSRIIAHPDRALTRRIIAANADYSAADSWLPRRMPRLLHQAGLVDVQIEAFTILTRDANSVSGLASRRGADIAAQAGAISAEERDAWLAGLDAEAAAGGFFLSTTYLLTWAMRPRKRSF